MAQYVWQSSQLLLCRGRGPNKEFRRLLGLHARVVIIDEFRTSQVCASCDQRSLRMFLVDGRCVYALKVCHHCVRVRPVITGIASYHPKAQADI